ncbi:hypothetical protein C0991_005846 [Blastosporella zonata]|nr:hypothetical protein C0991_005846 [Blastosporella zonata]
MSQMFDTVSGWEFYDMLTERTFNGIVFGGGLVSTQGKVVYSEGISRWVAESILISIPGDQHKKQRKMLSPVFSIAHMRQMSKVPLFNDVAKRLENTLKAKLANEAQEIDILHWMGRTALELIGKSGLGYSFDPLVEGAMPHPFSEAAKAFIPTVAKTFIEQEYLLPIIVKFGSPKLRRWLLDHCLPFKRYSAIRDIVDTWHRTTTGIFEGKKRALEEGDEALANQVGQAKDLMSILMKANMEASEEDKLPDSEVLAQASQLTIAALGFLLISITFAFAATDTTSNALSRTLHLLATHPEAQERLRVEIIEARKAHGADLPYEDLVALPYMDAVCRETLRLHAPVPKVMRVAREDVVLPLLTPIKGVDGCDMESILVPKNTKIIISILNANRDPLLWGPDSLEWKPERWLTSLPEALHEAHMPGIYSHLLTFLGGGRACIGFKFSQLEMKVILFTLISQFRFSPSKEEVVWQMTGITTPMLKKAPGKPQLPLRMELVNDPEKA